MTTSITTRLVKIGNSQGVRIPKALLEQVGLNGDVQVEVENDRLVLRPVSQRRQGWEEQFERMAQNGDDKLIDGEPLILTEWEEKEW